MEITVPDGEVNRMEYVVKLTDVPSPSFKLTCFNTVPPADKGFESPDTRTVLDNEVAQVLFEFQVLYA